MDEHTWWYTFTILFRPLRILKYWYIAFCIRLLYSVFFFSPSTFMCLRHSYIQWKRFVDITKEKVNALVVVCLCVCVEIWNHQLNSLFQYLHSIKWWLIEKSRRILSSVEIFHSHTYTIHMQCSNKVIPFQLLGIFLQIF